MPALKHYYFSGQINMYAKLWRDRLCNEKGTIFISIMIILGSSIGGSGETFVASTFFALSSGNWWNVHLYDGQSVLEASFYKASSSADSVADTPRRRSAAARANCLWSSASTPIHQTPNHSLWTLTCAKCAELYTRSDCNILILPPLVIKLASTVLPLVSDHDLKRPPQVCVLSDPHGAWAAHGVPSR